MERLREFQRRTCCRKFPEKDKFLSLIYYKIFSNAQNPGVFYFIYWEVTGGAFGALLMRGLFSCSDFQGFSFAFISQNLLRIWGYYGFSGEGDYSSETLKVI